MTFVLAETLDDVLAAAMPPAFLAQRPGIDDTLEFADPTPGGPEPVAAVA